MGSMGLILVYLATWMVDFLWYMSRYIYLSHECNGMVSYILLIWYWFPYKVIYLLTLWMLLMSFQSLPTCRSWHDMLDLLIPIKGLEGCKDQRLSSRAPSSMVFCCNLIWQLMVFIVFSRDSSGLYPIDTHYIPTIWGLSTGISHKKGYVGWDQGTSLPIPWLYSPCLEEAWREAWWCTTTWRARLLSDGGNRFFPC